MILLRKLSSTATTIATVMRKKKDVMLYFFPWVPKDLLSVLDPIPNDCNDALPRFRIIGNQG
jgi:hypothetical protein